MIQIAKDMKAGPNQTKEDENILSAVYTPPKLLQKIHSGKLRDAKSIAGLLYYFRFIAPEQPRRKKN
jgi:hypothetical protein